MYKIHSSLGPFIGFVKPFFRFRYNLILILFSWALILFPLIVFKFITNCSERIPWELFIFNFITVMIGMRVYFEIRLKANNLPELLAIIEKFTERISNDDKIFIVCPTPFLGYFEFKNFFAKYSELINQTNVSFACLGNNSEEILKKLSRANSKEDFDIAIGELTTSADELLNFHLKEMNAIKKVKLEKRNEYFKKLGSFLSEKNFEMKELKDFKKDSKMFPMIFMNPIKSMVLFGSVRVRDILDVDYCGELLYDFPIDVSLSESIFNSYI